jgi:ribonucleoside-triphosphate reductase
MAENLGVKNAKWDTEDSLMVPRKCYNSYFYVVEDEYSTLLDKIALHGKSITQFLDGGSALHVNSAG